MSWEKTLLIIGCGGHSVVVTEIAELVGFKQFIFVNTLANAKIKEFLGWPVLEKVPENWSGPFFVAIGDNTAREDMSREVTQKNSQMSLITLIHPSSVVSKRAEIGLGTVVMPLCVINGESLIGDGVIVNTRSSVDHHSVLMNFSSIAPGVTLGGRVKIGERSAISIGTYVRNSINIGSDTVVGVGSVVLHDIPSNTVAYGIPAKTIRSRSRGEKYL